MRPAPSWVTVNTCGSCDDSRSQVVRRVQNVQILRCSTCGTLRASRVLAPESVYVEGYHRGEGDLHPFDYTAPLSLEHEKLNNSRRLDRLTRYLKQGRLLDVGGGIGTLTAQAIERGFDAVNLEPIEEAVEYALSQKIPSILGGIEDVSGGGDQRGTFDAVTMMHVLEHLPRSREALEMAGDLLRPGGYVMVEVPHHGSMSRVSSGEAWLGWWPGQHIYYFTKRSLADLLARAGLEVVDGGTMVLTFDGLILDHYAYIVGMGPFLKRALKVKRRLASAGNPQGDGTIPQDDRAATGKDTADAQMPPALREQPAKRRFVLPVLRSVARMEEALGVGETLWAIARKPAKP